MKSSIHNHETRSRRPAVGEGETVLHPDVGEEKVSCTLKVLLAGLSWLPSKSDTDFPELTLWPKRELGSPARCEDALQVRPRRACSPLAAPPKDRAPIGRAPLARAGPPRARP